MRRFANLLAAHHNNKHQRGRPSVQGTDKPGLNRQNKTTDRTEDRAASVKCALGTHHARSIAAWLHANPSSRSSCAMSYCFCASFTVSYTRRSSCLGMSQPTVISRPVEPQVHPNQHPGLSVVARRTAALGAPSARRQLQSSQKQWGRARRASMRQALIVRLGKSVKCRDLQLLQVLRGCNTSHWPCAA